MNLTILFVSIPKLNPSTPVGSIFSIYFAGVCLLALSLVFKLCIVFPRQPNLFSLQKKW